MSFLFENITRCIICSDTIKSRREALHLPYINRNDFPDLALFARSFVHRDCFNNWYDHDKFVNAAFTLEADFFQDNKPDEVVFGDKYLLVTGKGDRFSINDFYRMVKLDIDYAKAKIFLNYLNDVRLKIDSEINMDRYSFVNNGDAIVVTEYENKEIVDEVVMPHFRIDAYIMAFEEIIAKGDV